MLSNARLSCGERLGQSRRSRFWVQIPALGQGPFSGPQNGTTNFTPTVGVSILVHFVVRKTALGQGPEFGPRAPRQSGTRERTHWAGLLPDPRCRGQAPDQLLERALLSQQADAEEGWLGEASDQRAAEDGHATLLKTPQKYKRR